MNNTLRPENRLSIDYRSAAAQFPKLPYPIIDVHTHILGARASLLYREICGLFGVGLTFSMTPLRMVDTVQAALGDAVRFIAIQDFASSDPKHAFGEGFRAELPQFYEKGARIVKFWSAPRGLDIGRRVGDESLLRLNSPLRIAMMQDAMDLGMMFMTHVGDPDTWFTSRYSNAEMYGTKRDHYKPLEEMVARFHAPWIAAHMGGWPEDLEFLDGLLSRHDNLYLDTSATKWIVRELSKHSSESLIEFLRKWKGRLLFGSDIVTNDAHLSSDAKLTEMEMRASSESEAFDLYASRYWALRTLWETDYSGESPIADPDLAMVDPQRFNELDAPSLRGHSIPSDLLQELYHDAAQRLFRAHGVLAAE